MLKISTNNDRTNLEYMSGFYFFNISFNEIKNKEGKYKDSYIKLK